MLGQSPDKKDHSKLMPFKKKLLYDGNPIREGEEEFLICPLSPCDRKKQRYTKSRDSTLAQPGSSLLGMLENGAKRYMCEKYHKSVVFRTCM